MITPIPKCQCPHCGIEITAAANFDGYTPEPGDPVICIKCLEISQFSDDLTVEPITDDNLLASSFIEIQKVRRLLIDSRRA